MAGRFRYDLIPAGSRVLCALSGGPDSMYLLCRLLEGAQDGAYTVCAAHFNHNLRPTAGRDEAFVRDWCHRQGVPLMVGSEDVAAYAAASGMGLEEGARTLRYDFLRSAACRLDCTLIATGHHAGDNAETILMNLIRGCGLGGLSGIPEQRDSIIRPMLAITRAEVERFLADGKIPCVEDETNRDQTYTRNRIRGQLLPLLEELNPRAAEHLCAAGQRAAADHRELNRQSMALLEQCSEEEGGTAIPLSALTTAPEPVAVRALMSLVPGAGAVHLDALLALCRTETPSARLDLPGVQVTRAYDKLILLDAGSSPLQAEPLRMGTQRWGAWRITCTPALCPGKAYVSPEEFYLKEDAFLIRPRREGDLLQLGPRPQKTIKKWMIEAKIPRHLRGRIPVLADGTGQPAAAGGLGPHRAALALPGAPCLRITMRKEERDASGCGTDFIQ